MGCDNLKCEEIHIFRCTAFCGCGYEVCDYFESSGKHFQDSLLNKVYLESPDNAVCKYVGQSALPIRNGINGIILTCQHERAQYHAHQDLLNAENRQSGL
jgi:hypothetical protein